MATLFQFSLQPRQSSEQREIVKCKQCKYYFKLRCQTLRSTCSLYIVTSHQFHETRVLFNIIWIHTQQTPCFRFCAVIMHICGYTHTDLWVLHRNGIIAEALTTSELPVLRVNTTTAISKKILSVIL